MQTKTMFIPSKLKIGFQERQGTFTGKLAYVVYYDEKGKLRKQTSWEGWRDRKIEPIEIDNIPQKGFIFNKGVQRSSEWFGSGRSMIRVYDSRDFEFEICVDNLIQLLMHSDVSKREILEECVFAWYGTELVLLPINSIEYQQSVAYTEKQSLKVSAKDLVKGRRYYKKKSDNIVTYIGYFEWWEWKKNYARGVSAIDRSRFEHISKGKKHIFWTGVNFETLSISVLSHMASDDIVDDYADLVDKFFATDNSQSIVGFKTAPWVVDPTGTRYGYPSMYRVIENGIERIYCNRSFSRGDIPLNRMTFNSYIVDTMYPPDSSVKLIDRHCTKEHYYSYTSYTDMTVQFQAFFREKLLEPELSQEISCERYIEIMSELGYGELKVVLQNGSEADYTF